jgi:cation diffusion facilitator CzcD-associated flavoprotein CzcO
MSNASGTGPGNSKLRHVIIGAGAAGVTAAETLRHLDPQARITVLDGEGEPPYSRMASPYYLAGQIRITTAGRTSSCWCNVPLPSTVRRTR